MTEHPQKSTSGKVTLERLIQLKRSERPDPSFWDDFERDLHRRQLAALVTVEPWRRRAARTLVTLARRLAPAGAGATAIALVVLALHRVDTPRPAVVAQPLEAEIDNKVVLLPEEQMTVSSNHTQNLRPVSTLASFKGQVHSAPQELASTLAVARRFVTVAAPVTFSSENDASAIYSANALTAGAVFRTMAASTPESL